jgi:Fe-S-cluster formation regulator IscX/YfhJ
MLLRPLPQLVQDRQDCDPLRLLLPLLAVDLLQQLDGVDDEPLHSAEGLLEGAHGRNSST